MKKLLVSIFCIFYLGIASGATVHFHYCMGELLSWGFSEVKSSSCDNCGMEKSGADFEKCCKDETKQLKVEKAQKAETNIQFGKLPPVILSTQLLQNSPPALPAVNVPHPLSHAPPHTGKDSLFLRIRSLRI